MRARRRLRMDRYRASAAPQLFRRRATFVRIGEREAEPVRSLGCPVGGSQPRQSLEQVLRPRLPHAPHDLPVEVAVQRGLVNSARDGKKSARWPRNDDPRRRSLNGASLRPEDRRAAARITFSSTAPAIHGCVRTCRMKGRTRYQLSVRQHASAAA